MNFRQQNFQREALIEGAQTLIIIDIPPKLVYYKEVRGVAQLGSASDLGSEGRMFKSCRPDHYKNKKSQVFLRFFFVPLLLQLLHFPGTLFQSSKMTRCLASKFLSLSQLCRNLRDTIVDFFALSKSANSAFAVSKSFTVISK